MERRDGEIHLQIRWLVVKLSSDVYVGSTGPHGSTGDQAAFDQLVRVMTHDLTVFARPRLPLVRVHHQVFGPEAQRENKLMYAFHRWEVTKNKYFVAVHVSTFNNYSLVCVAVEKGKKNQTKQKRKLLKWIDTSG